MPGGHAPSSRGSGYYQTDGIPAAAVCRHAGQLAISGRQEVAAGCWRRPWRGRGGGATGQAHHRDRPSREVRAAQGQCAAGREELRVLRALHRGLAGRCQGFPAAHRCRWMTAPSPKPSPLPAPCMPWPGPRKPFVWRCRERPGTGPAMPQIRPSGQIRSTPAPLPTESRPATDKKMSIYGLGCFLKIDLGGQVIVYSLTQFFT